MISKELYEELKKRREASEKKEKNQYKIRQKLSDELTKQEKHQFEETLGIFGFSMDDINISPSKTRVLEDSDYDKSHKSILDEIDNDKNIDN